jgi:hypothetical protein
MALFIYLIFMLAAQITQRQIVGQLMDNGRGFGRKQSLPHEILSQLPSAENTEPNQANLRIAVMKPRPNIEQGHWPLDSNIQGIEYPKCT